MRTSTNNNILGRGTPLHRAAALAVFAGISAGVVPITAASAETDLDSAAVSVIDAELAQEQTIEASTLSLLRTSGFAPTEGLLEFRTVEAASTLSIGRGATIELPADADGSALAGSGGLMINGTLENSEDSVVSTADSFAVITETHGLVEHRFSLDIPERSEFQELGDGTLVLVDEAGSILTAIAPAYAVDEAGANHPASYAVDDVTQELVLRADTTNATGSVLIDPSWSCYAKLAGIGAVWIIFTAAVTWGTGGLAWAIGVWGNVSAGAAWSIAQSCT